MNYAVEHWVGHVVDVVSFLVGNELTMSCWENMVVFVGAGFVKRISARKLLTVVLVCYSAGGWRSLSLRSE